MEGEPEAYVDDTLRSAGISPRERLERIENILTRMDEKLDNKADALVVNALIARIAALELAGALVAQQSSSLASDVRDKLDSKIEKLQGEHAKLDKKLSRYAGAVAVILFLAPFVWEGVLLILKSL